jgi:hypothetical protein
LFSPHSLSAGFHYTKKAGVFSPQILQKGKEMAAEAMSKWRILLMLTLVLVTFNAMWERPSVIEPPLVVAVDEDRMKKLRKLERLYTLLRTEGGGQDLSMPTNIKEEDIEGHIMDGLRRLSQIKEAKYRAAKQQTQAPVRQSAEKQMHEMIAEADTSPPAQSMAPPIETNAPPLSSPTSVPEPEEVTPPPVRLTVGSSLQDRLGLEPSRKPRLILITPTNRPWYLSRGIHYVLPLLRCFDVRWVIIHTFNNKHAVFSPAFRGVYPWVTELHTYHEVSAYGGHERNSGRDYVVNTFSGDAMVYFLDDDNTLPDFCSLYPVFQPAELQLQTLYYADQYYCGDLRLTTYGKNWSVWQNHSRVLDQVACLMDTGSFLIPLALLRVGKDIMWGLTRGSDAPFLAKLVTRWMEHKGSLFIKRLRSVRFHYNQMSELNGCVLNPWNFTALNSSLKEYRDVLQRMTAIHQSKLAPQQPRSIFKKVALHEYGHILGPVRAALHKPPGAAAVFLEVGVGLGANLLYMSRHESLTHTIGVVDLVDVNQVGEINRFSSGLRGRGAIDLVDADIYKIRAALSRLNATKADIVLIGVGETVEQVKRDFHLYKDLVAEDGFLIFDEFTDPSESNEVRRALMELTRDGKLNAVDFEVIGTVGNRGFAGPYMGTEEDVLHDWPSAVSKMHILRTRTVRRFLTQAPRRLKTRRLVKDDV